MGGSNSTTRQSTINSAIANIVNTAVLKNTQNCQNALSIGQNVTLTCNPSDAAIQLAIQGKTACVVAGRPASVCNSIVACNLTNVNQSATASFTGGCTVDNKQIQDIQSSIAAQMKASAAQTNDVIGQGFQALAQGAAGGGSTTNIVNTQNKIIQDITNSIDQQFVQNLVNQFAANQNVTITGAALNVNGITQDMQLTITAGALSSNSSVQSAVAQLSGTQSSDATVKNQTPLNALFDAITSIVGSVTGTYIVSIIMGGFSVLFIVYILYKFLGGEGGGKGLTDSAASQIGKIDVDSLIKNQSQKGGDGQSNNYGKFNLTTLYNTFKMNQTLVVIAVLLVGLYFYSCNEKKKEPFWYYSNCIYNAQNRMTCANETPFRGYDWFWQNPTRLQDTYDLRGDGSTWPYRIDGGQLKLW